MILHSARSRTGHLCLAALLVPTPLQHRSPDSYTVRGEVIELSIHLDSVGVVYHDDGELEDPAPDLPGDDDYEVIQIVPAYGPHHRDGVCDLVEDIEDDEEFRHVGLLVTHEGAQEPVLLKQEVIVRFLADADETDVKTVVAAHGLVEEHRSLYVEGLHLYALPDDLDIDPIEMVQRLNLEPTIDYAEPNGVLDVERTSAPQWHLHNAGESEGALDADIDAHRAWQITRGSNDVVIAILEDGFDVGHPSLAPNLWYDPATGEPGKSFYKCSSSDCDPALDGEQSDHGAISHGTAVAGCAAAVRDEDTGVEGSCPECALMLIRRSLTHYEDAQAIHFAWSNGADIISNSWRYPTKVPVPVTVADAIKEARTKGRNGKGSLVLFSVRNSNTDLDLFKDEICHEPGVLVVGSVANTDEHVARCGYGDCISILGPSRYNRSASAAVGTLNIMTTDWRGEGNGYNHDPELQVKMMDGWDPCADFAETYDYTRCFGGSSAATPIVAGVAGLALAAAPDLTELQLRRLLQDTADRAHPEAGQYDPINGCSTSRRTGNGRVNAYEAVHVIAPAATAPAHGGRGGIDLLLRDNDLDWGNTDVPSFVRFDLQRNVVGHWLSPDIKIDREPYASVTDGAAFEAFADEGLLAGESHRVYVRIRNRGPKDADPAEVALFWAYGGGACPPLPAGFWGGPLEAAAGTGDWHNLGVESLPAISYCGPSIAGTSEDAPAVVTFELEAPSAPTGGSTTFVSLFAVVDGDTDPLADTTRSSLVVDELVPRDNNAALRTVLLQTTSAQAAVGRSLDVRLAAHNALDQDASTWVEVIAPAGATLTLKTQQGPRTRSMDSSTFTPLPNDASRSKATSPVVQLPADTRFRVDLVGQSPPGQIEIRQWRTDPNRDTLAGGATLTLR